MQWEVICTICETDIEYAKVLVYKNLISFGTAYVENFIRKGEEDTYIREWMEDYYKMIADTVGEETIDLYAVMGDTVYTWGEKEGNRYDVSQAMWYGSALAADGEVFYTDFYFSDIYQRPVITIVEECGDTGMVLAFVVFPENFRVHSNTKLLPEGSSYYELLRTFRGVIAEDMYDEFVKNFSIENMREQIEGNVKNYGGGFQRLFNGERKWVNVRMLFALSFRKDEVVLCFQQVEEEKQRQMERMALLKRAVEMAHASEKSQKQFFSSMSHDMRMPLNVTIGMSELAEQHVEETEKVTDYLRKINMSSRQLPGLINDILEMSRLEQGVKLDSEEFNLREAVEEELTVFRIQAEEQHKKFLSNCEVTHVQVRGDVLRLNQVINNLLSNALKFTVPGESIGVFVYEISEGGHAKYQIVVKDTGRGMTEEFLQKLFVPYAREKRYGFQSVEGTGLGMPIVKNIVTLMGGKITVESPLEGRQILLAEDYELNMELATDILEMNGVKVLQARDGKEALEIFEDSEEFSIDAILMDMQMPVMDGREATKEIRRLERADAKIGRAVIRARPPCQQKNNKSQCPVCGSCSRHSCTHAQRFFLQTHAKG